MPDQSKVKEQTTLSCIGCNRAIQLCSFCDEDRCRSAICYHCLVTSLGRWKKYPEARTT